MRYLLLIKEHWQVLLISTLVVTALAVGLSFIPPQQYQSEVDLLIVQKQNSYTDSYTAEQAAENIGTNLINIINSLDFLNRVLDTHKLASSDFSTEPQQQKKDWNAMVKAQVVPSTGIIQVFGYGTTQTKAEAVALGVSQVLTQNSADYYGGSDYTAIKQIDGPITSNHPVKPNIPLNGTGAGLLTFLAVYCYFLIRAETKRLDEERKLVHYELPAMPLEPTQYRVIDQFPVYTHETNQGDISPTSMQDHLNDED